MSKCTIITDSRVLKSYGGIILSINSASTIAGRITSDGRTGNCWRTFIIYNTALTINPAAQIGRIIADSTIGNQRGTPINNNPGKTITVYNAICNCS